MLVTYITKNIKIITLIIVLPGSTRRLLSKETGQHLF